MHVRDNIKNLCFCKGITQRHLAASIGMSDVSLNRSLRGEYPQLQTLEKIAKVLNVPVVELFERHIASPTEPIVSGLIACPTCGTIIKLSAEATSGSNP
jgi:transcriptional regulator with XRE-family HTH domain